MAGTQKADNTPKSDAETLIYEIRNVVRYWEIPRAYVAKVVAGKARRARERFGSACGCTVFLRIIRDEALLELRALGSKGRWSQLAAYPILAQGCPAAPKQREGDGLSPEGFYRLSAAHGGAPYPDRDND